MSLEPRGAADAVPGMSAGHPQRFVGLMSGTSLDGVDAALCEWSRDGRLRLVGTHYQPFPDDLRERLQVLCVPGHDELELAGACGREIAVEYADATAALLNAARVDSDTVRAIGCHGQTVRHRPEAGFSIQVVNPALLAELAGIDVIADFRNRDLAAGGQGAPLVPAFHAAAFGGSGKHRVVVNIGGFANITDLPVAGAVGGFDTGPGNALLDLWVHRHHDLRYDNKGTFAASGTTLPQLLERLFDDPYFSLAPPKSTGREHFNHGWLDRHLRGNESPADIQATLAALTAESIARSIETYCPGAQEILVCGGGAHNDDLMRRLSERIEPVGVETTAVCGIDPDWVEAVAFAWLARQWVLRLPGNIAEATGAEGPRILGACYPA